MAKVIVMMGVSGCGKTTAGKLLAEKLSCAFHDADDYHPPENIAKMADNIPLDDNDRHPWLMRLNALIGDTLAEGNNGVLACSALKHSYRDLLRQGHEDGVVFVYLRGDFELIWERMAQRTDHYMQAEMLRSQFDALEEPDADAALIVDIGLPVDAVVERVLAGG